MTACSCDYGQLQPFAEALNQLLGTAEKVSETEVISIENALGRVLAEPVCSAVAVPPADNSAMDGYAVNTSYLPDDLILPISQRIAAGEQGEALTPGTAARIFTGSEIPPGADAVVMQEQCETNGDTVQLNITPEAGDHIRQAGQDILAGQSVIGCGTHLDGRHLGVIAAVGKARVRVFRKLKVAILTTGDELQMPGETPEAGKIFNSNYFTLAGLLQAMGVEVIYSGITEDDPEITRKDLLYAAQNSDLVISSGGVSVGEEDHVKAAVEALGELMLWRLAIKPGKPLAYGQVCGTPLIGLPGNPSAVLVTFLMLAKPYIMTMQGGVDVLPQRFKVKSGFKRIKAVAREEFLRVALRTDNGEIFAQPAHNQSSGVLSSAIVSDGLLVVPADHLVAEGDLLEFIPFKSLLG